MNNYIKGRNQYNNQGYQYDIEGSYFPFIYNENKFDQNTIKSSKAKNKFKVMQLEEAATTPDYVLHEAVT
tara:strand:- start:294 stop:503 length:210 start_codon:yes stop_codon:yes gene_type:complete